MKFVRNIPAHLDKHCGNKDLLSLSEAAIRNLNTTWGGTVAARYYKGIGADGDNLVIVQFWLDKSPLLTASAVACTTQSESPQRSAPAPTAMLSITFW